MRRIAIIASGVSALAALPAVARPLERELPLRRVACWERVYDAAHLAAHPRQKIAEIRLVHTPSPDGGDAAGLYLQLYLNLRQRVSHSAHDYKYGGFCKTQGRGLRCEAEWEAGIFTVEAGPNGALVVRNGGITANPLAYDSEDIADNAVKIPARPDDGIWSLRPAAGACRVE